MLSFAATLGIIGVGILIVVGGILGFRLHAFLALITAALAVSLLTPTNVIEWHELARLQFTKFEQEETGLLLQVKQDEVNHVGRQLLVVRRDEKTGHPTTIGTVTITDFTTREVDGFTRDFAETRFISLEGETLPATAWEFDRRETLLLSPADRTAARGFSRSSVGDRIAIGFGHTCIGIGILIAMAAIIGKCLLDSGAADKIVRWTLSLVGEKNAPLAFIVSGFALSTPVFFDTVFYLMIPLGKAMRMRTGRNYLLYIMAIVMGGAVAHSLVPPTPGPLFVAEALGVDIGLMILVGGVIGFCATLTGAVYAQFVCRTADIPLRESPDFSLKDLEKISSREDKDLPPIWLAVLPVILPVFLIAGATVVDTVLKGIPSSEVSPWMDSLKSFFHLFGNKNIAMAIAAFLSILMLVRQKHSDLAGLATALQSALSSGGVIILITAAGGAFGRSLQQTGIAGQFGEVTGASPAMVLGIAFLVTAIVRFAQGSATVSMITGVGVMASFATSGTLSFHPVYLALAIGFGSKMFMWMNDSGFWVIGKMSGMTELETLKYITPLTSLMGFTGLIFTVIAATIFPMV